MSPNESNNKEQIDDEHEHDVVMPGFRFHPTEEELIEFYLRRKVEGKRFNVELITFLDLYRYDPWELPAMAAIGEKEWFFYVPRDRKYRNGDRPNRVTTSGYWKATGADRTIKSENLRSIGLKKTLVFYSGKAPKGIRSSWIMNEYRLPHHETERLQKVEISLCRVYKRPGVEDHPFIPRSFPTKASSSSASSSNSKRINKNCIITPNFQSAMERSFQALGDHINPHLDEYEKMSETSASSTTEIGNTNLSLSKHDICPNHINPNMSSSLDIQVGSNLPPIFTSLSSSNLAPLSNHSIDDLHRLVNFQQFPFGHHPIQQIHHFHPSHLSNSQPQIQNLSTMLGTSHTVLSDKFWEWSSIADQGNKDFNNSFK